MKDIKGKRGREKNRREKRRGKKEEEKRSQCGD